MDDSLKLAYSTGPGLYAANSKKADKTVPEGRLRVYLARIETYDGPIVENFASTFSETQFKLLVSMAEGNPAVAKALVTLHHALEGNIEFLRAEMHK